MPSRGSYTSYTPAVMAIRCRQCGVPPRKRCKDGYGQDVAPHKKRRTDAGE